MVGVSIMLYFVVKVSAKGKGAKKNKTPQKGPYTYYLGMYMEVEWAPPLHPPASVEVRETPPLLAP
jgi:hypothetical protein